jgi:hypothetical protein
MTTLMLDDNLVARLKTRADAEGVGVEQYLARLLEQVPSATLGEAPLSGADDLDAFLDEFFAQNPEKLPAHDERSYSREDIYFDHD